MSVVFGHVEPGFEPVRDVFRQNFEEKGEIGAGFCVYHEGKRVVDLWGGVAHRGIKTPWEADTLVNIFSGTKGMAALCFLMLEDRGEVDLDSKVVEHWPEFGLHGKDAITIRHVLNHRSGAVALAEDLSLEDLEDTARMEGAMERAPLMWPAGEGQGYHAITYGIMATGLFRRITGETMGAFLKREIRDKLQADVFLGVPVTEDARVAMLYPAGTPERLKTFRGVLGRPFSREARFLRNVLLRPSSPGSAAVRYPTPLGGRHLHNYNLPRVRRLELAWANGHASARGLARMYAPLALGGVFEDTKVVSEEAASRPVPRQSWAEHDITLRKPQGWSQGFLKEQTTLFAPTTSWFGHPGIGGSMGFADPEARISGGYTINKMRLKVRSPTAIALTRKVYEVLGYPPFDPKKSERSAWEQIRVRSGRG